MNPDVKKELDKINIESAIDIVRQGLDNVTKIKNRSSEFELVNQEKYMSIYNNASSNERRRMVKDLVTRLNEATEMAKLSGDIAVDAFDTALFTLLHNAEDDAAWTE